MKLSEWLLEHEGDLGRYFSSLAHHEMCERTEVRDDSMKATIGLCPEGKVVAVLFIPDVRVYDQATEEHLIKLLLNEGQIVRENAEKERQAATAEEGAEGAISKAS